jgi:hypothetical protein
VGVTRRGLVSILLAFLVVGVAPAAAGSETIAPAAPAAAATTTVTLTPSDRGWFDLRGFHDAATTNYMLGNVAGLPSGRLHNFFVFDLSGVSGTVVSAQLSAANNITYGPGDTWTLYDVTTPAASFSADASTATAVYDDLGSGTVYGSVTLADPTISPVVVPLNGAGVTALQAAIGGPVVLGGDYAPSATDANYLFGATDGHAVQLVLTVEPASPVTLRNPYTVWTQPAATPLDGVGTWMATANDPAANAGQVPPSYLYAHGFAFIGSSALGFVGLVTGPGGKYAVASVVGPDGAPHDAVVPFDWAAGRLYFPFVYRFGPRTWGAWVYDEQAATWAPIGLLSLPATWGKLSPTAVSAVGWTASPVTACSAYPRADVYIQAPLGFVGSTASQATRTGGGATPGDCAPVPTVDSAPWARYRVGAL